jgi:hypothetical protein
MYIIGGSQSERESHRMCQREGEHQRERERRGQHDGPPEGVRCKIISACRDNFLRYLASVARIRSRRIEGRRQAIIYWKNSVNIHKIRTRAQ